MFLQYHVGFIISLRNVKVSVTRKRNSFPARSVGCSDRPFFSHVRPKAQLTAPTPLPQKSLSRRSRCPSPAVDPGAEKTPMQSPSHDLSMASTLRATALTILCPLPLAVVLCKNGAMRSRDIKLLRRGRPRTRAKDTRSPLPARSFENSHPVPTPFHHSDLARETPLVPGPTG